MNTRSHFFDAADKGNSALSYRQMNTMNQTANTAWFRETHTTNFDNTNSSGSNSRSPIARIKIIDISKTKQMLLDTVTRSAIDLDATMKLEAKSSNI